MNSTASYSDRVKYTCSVVLAGVLHNIHKIKYVPQKASRSVLGGTSEHLTPTWYWRSGRYQVQLPVATLVILLVVVFILRVLGILLF